METDDGMNQPGDPFDYWANEFLIQNVFFHAILQAGESAEEGFLVSIEFSMVRFEPGSKFSQPVISIILLFICFLLSCLLASRFLFPFRVSTIFLETELGLHYKPKHKEKNSKSQLYSTNDPHDKLILIVVVSKVRCLFCRVVVHNDQVKHQCAYEIGNVSGCFTDPIHEIWCDWKSHLFTSERFEFPVIELIILFNFLLNVLVVTK